MLQPVAAEICEVSVDIRQRDGRDKRQVHIVDVDLVQPLVSQCRIAGLLKVAEKIPHIQVIFIHGMPGMCLDSFVVAEKKPKHFRSSFAENGRLKENMEGYYKLIAGRLAKKGLISEIEADSIRPDIQVTGDALNSLVGETPESSSPTAEEQ